MEVFPNPASKEINLRIKGDAMITEVELISLTGSVVLYNICDGICNQLTLNSSALNSGFYLVRALTSEGVMISKVQILN